MALSGKEVMNVVLFEMAGNGKKYPDLRCMFMRGLIDHEKWQRTRHYLKSAAECTSRAIVSLELCEEPVRSLKQAQQLEGMGGETCKRLKKIQEEKNFSNLPAMGGQYISSAGAILVSLLDSIDEAKVLGHSPDRSVLTPENTVKRRAKRLCEEDFLDDQDEGFCKAWWRMEILIKRDLVKRRSLNKTPVYQLLPLGMDAAKRLRGDRGPVVSIKPHKPHVNQPLTPKHCDTPWEMRKNIVPPAQADDALYTNDTGEDGVLMLVDIQEWGGDKAGLGQLCKLLEQAGIRYRTKRLASGDYSWLWRLDGKDRILPFLVERKRADDMARTLKEGRFWSQINKMCAWKKDFTDRGITCQLQYILEGQPEQYVTMCADNCHGVGMCGNPSLTQVKNAIKDVKSHQELIVQESDSIEATVTLLAGITAELQERARMGDFDGLVAQELNQTSAPVPRPADIVNLLDDEDSQIKHLYDSDGDGLDREPDLALALRKSRLETKASTSTIDEDYELNIALLKSESDRQQSKESREVNFKTALFESQGYTGNENSNEDGDLEIALRNSKMEFQLFQDRRKRAYDRDLQRSEKKHRPKTGKDLENDTDSHDKIREPISQKRMPRLSLDNLLEDYSLQSQTKKRKRDSDPLYTKDVNGNNYKANTVVKQCERELDLDDEVETVPQQPLMQYHCSASNSVIYPSLVERNEKSPAKNEYRPKMNKHRQMRESERLRGENILNYSGTLGRRSSPNEYRPTTNRSMETNVTCASNLRNNRFNESEKSNEYKPKINRSNIQNSNLTTVGLGFRNDHKMTEQDRESSTSSKEYRLKLNRNRIPDAVQYAESRLGFSEEVKADEYKPEIGRCKTDSRSHMSDSSYHDDSYDSRPDRAAISTSRFCRQKRNSRLTMADQFISGIDCEHGTSLKESTENSRKMSLNQRSERFVECVLQYDDKFPKNKYFDFDEALHDSTDRFPKNTYFDFDEELYDTTERSHSASKTNFDERNRKEIKLNFTPSRDCIEPLPSTSEGKVSERKRKKSAKVSQTPDFEFSRKEVVEYDSDTDLLDGTPVREKYRTGDKLYTGSDRSSPESLPDLSDTACDAYDVIRTGVDISNKRSDRLREFGGSVNLHDPERKSLDGGTFSGRKDNVNRTGISESRSEEFELPYSAELKSKHTDNETRNKIKQILSILPHISEHQAAISLRQHNGLVELCISSLLEETPTWVDLTADSQ